jgi:tetratricopeptide (TPR) repeat protein
MIVAVAALMVPNAIARQETPSDPVIASQETPSDAEAADPSPDYLKIGNAAFEARDFQLAIDAFTQFSPIEILPQAQNRLGVSYFMLGRERDAEGTFRVATSRDRERAETYNNLGVLYYSREDFDDAEDRFRDAAERNPLNRNIQDNLHAAKYARENRDQARALAAQLRLTSPLLVRRLVGDMLRVDLLIPPAIQDELQNLETRGDIFLARKMYEDATAEYEQYLRIDRYNPFVANKLGLTFLQLQEMGDAERQFREALRVNPYYVPVLNNLGSLEQTRNRYQRAMGYYQDALEIQPEYSVVLQNVGALFFALEQYEEGLQFFIRALRADPTLFDADDSEGLPTLAQATRANEAMTNFYMAKVFANIGDADRTMSYLYRAVEEGFDDADLLADSVFSLLAEDMRFVQLMVTLQSSG